MARTLGAAGSDTAGWFLGFAREPIIRLREGGNYAGFPSVEELQLRLTEAERARQMIMDEEVPDQIEEFFFLDEESSFVSLFRLPLVSGRSTPPETWLRGKTDGGLCPIMQQVTAWNIQFDTGGATTLYVMTAQGKWVPLGKQGKAYERHFLSVFVLLSLLDFARKNLDATERVIWEHLRSIYSYCEEELPTPGELLEHAYTLRKLVSRDELLGASDYVQSLLKKRKTLDDDDVDDDTCKRQKCDLEDDDEVGESICAICDDGGNLLCCEGPCLRSFHGSKGDAGACKTLGLTEEEVKHTLKFFCNNCALNQHQCFSCGKLGTSQGSKQEVFLCDVALCGRFYHLSCAAKLLGGKPVDNGFTCPLHSCFKCHLREKEEESLWLYQCRRCPRAWHEACAGLSFDENDENRRGWVVGTSRFLYCMKHVLDPVLKTPKRDHLKFPSEPARDQTGKRAAKPSKIERGADQRQGVKASGFSAPIVFSKDVEDTVSEIMKSCKVDVEELKSRLIVPSTTRTTSNRNRLNRIQSLLNAFRKAYEFVQRGGNLDEAQLIFPPKDLKLLESCRDTLRVYLSPLMYGNRYSSFGRHFTRAYKLESIVDRLVWYVNAEDMIVDLCCGSNEFSRLLSSRLASMNKTCRFKNYDFFQPSDTFNFERRDYMEITPEELCPGDNLIMGLNPPFGTKAQLASKFLAHCVKFQPKLIVLIAPEETRRPDGRYVLTWEDKDLLKGDAFYLPGSVDTEGRTIKQENMIPPVLYLFSRIDFAEAHRMIALEHGHLGRSSVADAEGTANLDVGGALQLSTIEEAAAAAEEAAAVRRRFVADPVPDSDPMLALALPDLGEKPELGLPTEEMKESDDGPSVGSQITEDAESQHRKLAKARTTKSSKRQRIVIEQKRRSLSPDSPVHRNRNRNRNRNHDRESARREDGGQRRQDQGYRVAVGRARDRSPPPPPFYPPHRRVFYEREGAAVAENVMHGGGDPYHCQQEPWMRVQERRRVVYEFQPPPFFDSGGGHFYHQYQQYLHPQQQQQQYQQYQQQPSRYYLQYTPHFPPAPGRQLYTTGSTGFERIS